MTDARLIVSTERRTQPDRWWLLHQIGEHFSAGLRHARIRLVASGQCRPSALTDVGAFFPRVADRIQLAEIFVDILGVAELVDADRRQRGDDRPVGLLPREL